MVLLILAGFPGLPGGTIFTFQYGSINTIFPWGGAGAGGVFTFQYGSINTVFGKLM